MLIDRRHVLMPGDAGRPGRKLMFIDHTLTAPHSAWPRQPLKPTGNPNV